MTFLAATYQFSWSRFDNLGALCQIGGSFVHILANSDTPSRAPPSLSLPPLSTAMG